MSLTYNATLSEVPELPAPADPPGPLPRPVNPDGLADFGADTLDGDGLGV